MISAQIAETIYICRNVLTAACEACDTQTKKARAKKIKFKVLIKTLRPKRKIRSCECQCRASDF